MKVYIGIILALILSCDAGNGQGDLTVEEKAYLFRVLSVNKVLNRTMNNYINYHGPMVYQMKTTADSLGADTIKTKRVDYDSICKLISQDTALVTIEWAKICGESLGLKSELATQLAYWKLENMLSEELKSSGEESDVYNSYLTEVGANVISRMTIAKNGLQQLSPEYWELIDPNISLDDKKFRLQKAGLNVDQRRKVIEGISRTNSKFVKNLTVEYLQLMGVPPEEVSDVRLICAGDGGGAAGLLFQSIKGDKSKQFGEGLYNYQLTIDDLIKGDKNYLQAKENRQHVVATREPKFRYQLLGDGRITGLHLSLWDCSYEFQSTVVIKCNGESYLLFADKEMGELSPDSAFGSGKTYYKLMADLESSINELEEGLYGKRGFQYWVDFYTKKLEETKLNLKKSEYKLNAARYGQAKKVNKPVRKENKKRASKRDKLMGLYGEMAHYKTEKEKAQIALAEAEEKLQIFQMRLFEMKENIGHIVHESSGFGGVYIFDDGSVFNANAQDFIFKDSTSKDEFSVQLMAIGPTAVTARVDEVLLHTAVYSGSRVNTNFEMFTFTLDNQFEANATTFEKLKISVGDKYRLIKFLKHLVDNRYPELNGHVLGAGVGAFQEGRVMKSEDSTLFSTYGKLLKGGKRNQPIFRSKRASLIEIGLAGELVKFSITTFTDEVREIPSSSLYVAKSLKKAHPNATSNEIISAVRSKYVLDRMVGYLNNIASKNFSEKEQNKISQVLTEFKEQVQVKCL